KQKTTTRANLLGPPPPPPSRGDLHHRDASGGDRRRPAAAAAALVLSPLSPPRAEANLSPPAASASTPGGHLASEFADLHPSPRAAAPTACCFFRPPVRPCQVLVLI
uniref:Uncharacterized protein n=1 Tax=Oryza punctata TaxID=4537 RepID=A0A0E0MJS1_ORYPU